MEHGPTSGLVFERLARSSCSVEYSGLGEESAKAIYFLVGRRQRAVRITQGEQRGAVDSELLALPLLQAPDVSDVGYLVSLHQIGPVAPQHLEGEVAEWAGGDDDDSPLPFEVVRDRFPEPASQLVQMSLQLLGPLQSA